MPGIILQLDKRERGQHLPYFTQAAQRFAPDGQAPCLVDEASFRMALFSPSPLSLSHHQDPSGVEAWVYGAIYPRQGEAGIETSGPEETMSAAYAVQQYLGGNQAYLDSLNGEYHLVIRDPRQHCLLVLNDRFGIRPWYVHETEDVLVLSPDLKCLFPYLGGSPSLNLESVAGFLAINKLRLGNATVIDQLDVLPAAQAIEFDLQGRSIKRSTYWQFSYNDNMEITDVSDDTVQELIDTYSFAMQRRARVHENRRVGISLSGGLDSRTMVGALAPEQVKQVTAHTYGIPDSDEVQLAAEVCRVSGMSQTIYPMDAPDFIHHAHAGIQLSDELDIFVQGCWNHWLQPVQQNLDVIMTGVDLDVTLGGIYMTPDVLQAKNDQDILNLLKQKNKVFSEGELGQLFAGSLADVREAPYAVIEGLISDLPQESAPAKYDLFIKEFSMRRIIFLRYAMIRQFVETASPMYDYDFIDRILALPSGQRAGHRTFHPFINKLTPELSDILYQRTMLPPTVPVKYWARAADIEAQREQHYLDIWKETQGAVHVPYRRYYSNFDEWLRLSPEWIDMTDQLLGSKDSQIYQRNLVQHDFVNQCVTEHRNAQRSWRQPLICLMSLELYLQAYFT